MSAPRPALVACMRNEGIFVLEWLAHHAALGFAEIIVVSNDCTDGSDALLDRLAARGLVHHIRQEVPPGVAPQDAGMDLVLAHARARELTHLLHIDSDEFLYLPEGDLAALLARTRAADVVPIPWRMFGDSGVTRWTPGDLVTLRNTRAEPAPEPGRTKFKCLFRVASFARATDHNPLEPLVDAPLVLTPEGVELSNRSLHQAKSARFRPHELAAGARAAQLYHYAVRAEDCFLLKNDRGDGQGKAEAGGKYLLGSRWHGEANRNEVEAPALAARAPALRAQIAAWRADPETARLEAACGQWFEARRDSYLTPERRAALSARRRG
ncbi:glycosyltransferase family 2 protein [Pseudooceanicola sp. 200-1SW]|uniref:glycosyltransferase family 2 protein n=1 Tax=Pseudooceanicola sp. 200-1SW TaxID=3425949 RepID=UPI003D7F6938